MSGHYKCKPSFIRLHAKASVMSGKQQERGQSEGRGSMLPAGGPGGDCRSLGTTPPAPKPLLLLTEGDKCLHFTLSCLKPSPPPSFFKRQPCALVQGQLPSTCHPRQPTAMPALPPRFPCFLRLPVDPLGIQATQALTT